MGVSARDPIDRIPDLEAHLMRLARLLSGVGCFLSFDATWRRLESERLELFGALTFDQVVQLKLARAEQGYAVTGARDLGQRSECERD